MSTKQILFDVAPAPLRIVSFPSATVTVAVVGVRGAAVGQIAGRSGRGRRLKVDADASRRLWVQTRRRNNRLRGGRSAPEQPRRREPRVLVVPHRDVVASARHERYRAAV